MESRLKIGLVALLGAEHLGNRTHVYNDLEPFGLLYIGGVAKSLNHEVRVFHPYQKANPDEKSILEQLIKYKPNILGISSMTNTFNRSISLAKKIKSASPQTKVVIGGDHIGTNPSEVENHPVIDIGVYGEGEVTFKEILEGKPLDKIQGISYVDGSGELVINSPRQRVKDRTQLPLPIRDPEILKAAKVGKLMYPAASEQTGAASLLFQFGCPLGCTYCSATTLYGSKLTRSSVNSVVEEMKQLKDEFGINTAFFTDLTFNLNYQLSEELCSTLEKENLGISWYSLVRPTSPTNQPILRDSTLEAMVAGGCTKVGFGIESFEKSAMLDYHRPTCLDEDYRVLRKIDNLGTLSKIFFIIGHPDEDIEYYNQIIEKLKWLKPDEVRIAYITPFPGTELWKKLNGNREKHLLTTNYDDYTTFKPVMKMKHLTPEQLVKQRTRILREYYSSDEFHKHVKEKLRKNPRFNKSFDEFLRDINQ